MHIMVKGTNAYYGIKKEQMHIMVKGTNAYYGKRNKCILWSFRKRKHKV